MGPLANNTLPGQRRNNTPPALAWHAEVRLEERTTLSKEAVQDLLNARKYVPLGVQNGYRRAVVIYSEPDDRSYVVVQNYRTRKVITILPLSYWKFDELTENSAEAWQARHLVLEASEEDPSLESRPVQPSQTASSRKMVRPERRAAVRLLAEMAVKPFDTPAPAEGASPALLEQLSGISIGRPKCEVVLKLLRTQPYEPIIFPSKFLREDLAAMLVAPEFVSHVLSRIARKGLLNEDVLSFHLSIGTESYFFTETQCAEFFKACMPYLDAAAQMAADLARGEDSPVSPSESRETRVPQRQADDSNTAPVATALNGALLPAPVTQQLPCPSGQEKPKVAPKRRLSEFEQLLQDAGWAVRRPAVTARAFRNT